MKKCRKFKKNCLWTLAIFFQFLKHFFAIFLWFFKVNSFTLIQLKFSKNGKNCRKLTKSSLTALHHPKHLKHHLKKKFYPFPINLNELKVNSFKMSNKWPVEDKSGRNEDESWRWWFHLSTGPYTRTHAQRLTSFQRFSFIVAGFK